MKSSKLLAVIIVMQALILVGQWVQPSASPARADVQVTNPSERQLAIIDELKALNSKMDRMTGLLSSGEMKVVVERVEKKQ